MPERRRPGGGGPERSPAERAADHAAIERLSEELLPTLVARLAATGLGELEVREGTWRVRLRRAPGAVSVATVGTASAVGRDRRPGERDRTIAGGEHPGERIPRPPHHPDAVGGTRSDGRSDTRVVATSPAVGIYRPRTDLTVGDRVRSGDRIGAVDMLGVAQEVLAPIDGLIGASLAESGDAVEYGQDLLVVEAIVDMAGAAGSVTAERGAADVP